jgi:hypothetical protein
MSLVTYSSDLALARPLAFEVLRDGRAKEEMSFVGIAGEAEEIQLVIVIDAQRMGLARSQWEDRNHSRRLYYASERD